MTLYDDDLLFTTLFLLLSHYPPLITKHRFLSN